MKSVLDLVGVATFRGFRTAAGEIRLNMTKSTMEIEIRQETRTRYKAVWKNGCPLVSMRGGHSVIKGTLWTVEREVSDRFDAQLTPWKWTRNGIEVEPPSREHFKHFRDSGAEHAD